MTLDDRVGPLAPGFESNVIFASRVNDGICDCCDGADEWGAASPACGNKCKLHALEILRKERDQVERLEEGLRQRREYETNAKSSLLVNQLQLKHKREEVETCKRTIKNLKRELNFERSRHKLSKPELVLPRVIDTFDALTKDEQLVVDAVHRFLAKAGGACGEAAGGGGGGWPDERSLAAHLAREMPELHWGREYLRSLAGRAIADFQQRRGCSTWSAISGSEAGLDLVFGGGASAGGGGEGDGEAVRQDVAVDESLEAPAELVTSARMTGAGGDEEDAESDMEEWVPNRGGAGEGRARRSGYGAWMYRAFVAWWYEGLVQVVESREASLLSQISAQVSTSRAASFQSLVARVDLDRFRRR